MPQFAMLAEHTPELCPTANKQTRELMKEGAQQIPELANRLGINILTLRIFGPDHVILAVVEADDIEAVRDFTFESRLIQWNTINIHATYSMEEALERLDQLPAMF